MAIPIPITLSQLQAKIVSESQNQSTELANELTQIIQDGERICNYDLQLQSNRVIADGFFYQPGDVVNGVTLLTGQCGYIYLPPDLISERRFQWFTPAGSSPAEYDQYNGTAKEMIRGSEAMVTANSPSPSTVGPPTYYCITGNQQIYSTGNPSPLTGVLQVSPTPDQGYAYRISYETSEASLVELGANGYSYLSTWYSDLLFYACMIRYGLFVNDPEQFQAWTAIYTQTMKIAKEQEMRRKGESYKDLSETMEPITVRDK